jgi:hypothetical protein
MIFLMKQNRVFYETLLEQRPESEMAQDWCLAYGVLDSKRAAKLYEYYCKRKGLSSKVKVKGEKSPSPIKRKTDNNGAYLSL